MPPVKGTRCEEKMRWLSAIRLFNQQLRAVDQYFGQTSPAEASPSVSRGDTTNPQALLAMFAQSTD